MNPTLDGFEKLKSTGTFLLADSHDAMACTYVPAGFSPAVFQKFLTAVAKPRRIMQLAYNTVPLAINESYKSK